MNIFNRFTASHRDKTIPVVWNHATVVAIVACHFGKLYYIEEFNASEKAWR